MHVCKDYVTDSCSNGATCHWNHSFHNGKDRVWLSRIKLDQFIEEELRWLVLTSTPQICAEYNNGICQDGSSCTRIHTCIAYLLRRCKASGCGLSHEETMRSEHNRAVLDWYQVTDLDSGYLDQLILMNEEPLFKTRELPPTLLQADIPHIIAAELQSRRDSVTRDKSGCSTKFNGESDHSDELTTQGRTWSSSWLSITRNDDDAFTQSSY
ncbi:hypothetical protein pdam_00004717 [Pocillopora damicornis]|uniref:C3H1-type domain-containing protein n=1 Tax=Pocillopora damicornis TaxID=46731 RepID=A0A3M6UE24_POCDA|nr:hypothetical protein pdam_00004717 [Pocillopora damicornis]